MLTITKSAADRVLDLLKDKDASALRVYIQGGGCSGFQYGFELDKEAEEDDIIVKSHGIECFVDSLSMQYLEGAEVDFVSDLMGIRFVISNPNANTTCGCGSSFSV